MDGRVCAWMDVNGLGWVWMSVDGRGWAWMGVNGRGWAWMGVDGRGWAWMGVDGCAMGAVGCRASQHNTPITRALHPIQSADHTYTDTTMKRSRNCCRVVIHFVCAKPIGKSVI